MNERIRELAEQAKGFVDLNQHVGGDKGCMVYTYDGLEKFAELIIRECADIAMANVRELNLADELDFFRVIAVGEGIKQHFFQKYAIVERQSAQDAALDRLLEKFENDPELMNVLKRLKDK